MKVREKSKSVGVVAKYLGTTSSCAGKLARYGLIGVRQEDGTILVPGWELGTIHRMSIRLGCTVIDAARLQTLRSIARKLQEMGQQPEEGEILPLQVKGTSILWFLRRSKSRAVLQAVSQLAHDYGSGPGQFLQTA